MVMILFLLLVFAGCLSQYLTSPHQRWLARPLAAGPGRAAGAALLAGGLAILAQAVQLAAAVFTLCAWAMLVFVLLPYLGALFSLRRP